MVLLSVRVKEKSKRKEKKKKKKRGRGEGSTKESVKHDSYFLYISAKFTSNYFEAKSSKFFMLSQNSEFYSLDRCHSVKKWVVFVLGLLKTIFHFSRHLSRGKKEIIKLGVCKLTLHFYLYMVLILH